MALRTLLLLSCIVIAAVNGESTEMSYSGDYARPNRRPNSEHANPRLSHRPNRQPDRQPDQRPNWRPNRYPNQRPNWRPNQRPNPQGAYKKKKYPKPTNPPTSAPITNSDILFRPVSHVKSYTVINSCEDDINLLGQSGNTVKFNCGAQLGCHILLGHGETLMFDKVTNTDFVPIGDSLGSGERLQFAYDAECDEEVNKVWLELNQNPAICSIAGVDPPPGGHNAAGTMLSNSQGLAVCSDPTDYLEFGAEFNCLNPSQAVVNCNVRGARRVFVPGDPHVNFARQMGFTELNLKVSFNDEAGDPYCNGGVTRTGSPFSRAQTQMETGDCGDSGLFSDQQSAKVERICDKTATSPINACRPFCPNANFARSLAFSFPTNVNCNACTISNELINSTLSRYEATELNTYAKYLSDHACVWDGTRDVWLRQPYTVTTQEDYNFGSGMGMTRPGAREFNTNILPPPGVATAAGASMFECWDHAGTGSQGFGWPCDASKFTQMVVELCPKTVSCMDPENV